MALLIPCRDMVHSMFTNSLAHAIRYFMLQCPDDQITTVMNVGTIVSSQRQELVRAARKLGATHVIWLDSDMQFPPDAFVRLLSHGAQFVGCNYSRRVEPLSGVIYRTREDGTAEALSSDPSQTGLVEVDGIGMGLAAVEMRVFETLAEPHFVSPYNLKTNRFLGEDIFFCIAAREAGIRLFVDMDLSREIGHLGTYCFTLEDAFVWECQPAPS